MINRLVIAATIIVSGLVSCNSGEAKPDVSNIKINLAVERFEKRLFDTTANTLLTYLQHLQTNNPLFTSIYLTNILNVDPAWPVDSAADYVNGFIKAYRPVYDSAEKIFNDFAPYTAEIKEGLQYVKYYFPDYKLPVKIITYIGPADGYGDILSDEGIVIGLQHYLGKNFYLYKSELVQQTYPEYVSARFEPGYMALNSIHNIVNDLFPEKESDKPLINQMIEKGKRLYVLSKLLPGTEEYKLIAFTKDQLKDCHDKEAVIWDMFIKNSYLQIIDKGVIKNYIGEGPKTPELGEGAPGNIGSFSGWQIVKKYMQKKPATTLSQLMSLDTEMIFEEAKYKP